MIRDAIRVKEREREREQTLLVYTCTLMCRNSPIKHEMFSDAVFVGQNGLLRFLFGLLTSKKNMKNSWRFNSFHENRHSFIAK